MNDHAKDLILKVVDNPLFQTMFEELKLELAQEVLKVNLVDIPILQADARALDRLMGKLIEIANEVRVG